MLYLQKLLQFVWEMKQMEIGSVIRKYRKETVLAQKEMVNRLGVTAPAVNKWENGNTKPDIDLLAPIARLFNNSLDTLLSELCCGMQYNVVHL